MKTADFDFALPRELIAQRPATPRDSARLLDARAAFADLTIRDLPDLFAPDDLLVVNDTKVIPAQLNGVRLSDAPAGQGGGRIAVTLHKDEGGGHWRAFVKPARRLKAGDVVEFAPGFTAELTDRAEGGEVGLNFALRGADFLAALEAHGHAPLPPYIKRPDAADARDRTDYQTMFAAREGAVAAPTAGLHFTPEVMMALTDRGVKTAKVTLHVGAGTFLPVTAEDIADHRMHAEYGEISEETAGLVNATRTRGGRIVAIGTTALRLLESAATPEGALQAFAGDTRLFITPGYRFRLVDLLFTNFHLPRSTLFMLVSAFAGMERIRAAYDHAIRERYRFFSYGDAMLLARAKEGDE